MTRNFVKTFVILCLVLGAATGVAQTRPQAPVRMLPADTVVSLVTFHPGSDVYELEGHTALRVTTPEGVDFAANWGMFDFNSPNFVYRFVKGETDYSMGVAPWSYTEMAYRGQGRRITEHVLDMTPAQKRRLLELLEENARPENRVYRYNYVLDNCATRPLEMLEKALGDSIAVPQPEGEPSKLQTFRQMMTYYHRNYPWYQLGIDLALGSGIDKLLTARQKAYAPAALDTQIANATVNGKPLTANTVVVNDVAADNATLPATPWQLTPGVVFTLIFLLIAWATWRDWRRKRPTRWVDSVLFGALGVTGCVLTFLIFVSQHYATSPNWLYLWINPLGLLVAVTVWIKRAEKLLIWLQIAIFALIICGICAWPFTGQHFNPALLPLLLATMLRSGLYIGIRMRTRKNSK